MNLITIEHLKKSYTERLLFDDTGFYLEEGDKVGLIGINGTGKSTLLRIAAGLEEADEGYVVRGNNLTIRFLSQNPVFQEGKRFWKPCSGRTKGRLRSGSGSTGQSHVKPTGYSRTSRPG